MRLRFWFWLHNRLEDAWHWVYFNKLRYPYTNMRHPQTTKYEIKYGYAVVEAQKENLWEAQDQHSLNR